MKVVAISEGFYKGTRRRVGAVFDMPEEGMKKKDGKPVLPSWVKAVQNDQQAKAVAAQVKQDELDKQKAGAIAASGGKAAKTKAADNKAAAVGADPDLAG